MMLGRFCSGLVCHGSSYSSLWHPLAFVSTNQHKSFPVLAQTLPLRTRTLSFRATSCHSERSEESPLRKT